MRVASVPLWSGEVEQSQLFWSAATCRRLWPRRQKESGDKSPHSIRTRHLSVFCAHPDSRFFNCTLTKLCSFRHFRRMWLLLFDDLPRKSVEEAQTFA